MGELIQMNSHMVMADEACAMIIIGIVIAVGCIICAIITLIRSEKHQGRYFAIFLALAMIGVVFIVTGSNEPRKKVIMACANGPVSLEQVAAVYNIKDIDGKMLTLEEK